ncbi:Mitochondrial metal transporter 2 [Nakaseomyces bracarensis]|uniref:Mitochondrial metal transporter 2 n=1 Tax=Nakaseomyces bracarensis TaxID=273131 RepID=A0ABR4NLY5_9SACH
MYNSVLRRSYQHRLLFPIRSYKHTTAKSTPVVDTHMHTHMHTEATHEEGHSHEHEHGHGHEHTHDMKSMLTHSHSHIEANPLLTLSKEQMMKNPGVRITWIGLGSNVLMAVGKFFGGIAFHSQALLADSVHAMSDLISDFLTLFSVSLSSKKSNDQYPYGYGKVETVGSLAVSTILAGAGVSIGWASLCAVVGPMVPHAVVESLTSIFGSVMTEASSQGHSHSHTHIEATTDINAAWIAAGSIVMKEWIFQATKRVAVRTNSNVLMANAWHHRIDSLTSLVALVAIMSSHFFGVQSLDSLGGLLVSVLIIKAGAEGMVTSVKELTDQAVVPTDDRYVYVRDLLQKHLPQLDGLEVEKVTVMPMGPKLRAIATLALPRDTTLHVQDLDDVTAHLKEAMLEDTRMAFFDVRYTSQ